MVSRLRFSNVLPHEVESLYLGRGLGSVISVKKKGGEHWEPLEVLQW